MAAAPSGGMKQVTHRLGAIGVEVIETTAAEVAHEAGVVLAGKVERSSIRRPRSNAARSSSG
jgi:hypothetical protein